MTGATVALFALGFGVKAWAAWGGDGPRGAERGWATWIGTSLLGATVAMAASALGMGEGLIALAVAVAGGFAGAEIVPRALGGPRHDNGESSAPPGPLPGDGLAALAVRWRPRRVGELDLERDQVLRRLVSFRDSTAVDLMVPLVAISAVGDDRSVGDVIGRVRRDGYSRIPVFHERMFNIVGLVHAQDLLGLRALDQAVTEHMRSPSYVPARKAADALLVTLRFSGNNLAIVVDELGGAIGLVTVEDLLEAIVGEIRDEYDVEGETVESVGPERFRLDARMRVTRANERFGWALPEGEYETLGGLVTTLLGRIPLPGEDLEVVGMRLRVAEADARAVRKVDVQPTNGEETS